MWLLKSTFLSEQTIDLLCPCITITEGLKMSLCLLSKQALRLFSSFKNIVFSSAHIVSPGDRPLLCGRFYSELVLVIRCTLSC